MCHFHRDEHKDIVSPRCPPLVHPVAMVELRKKTVICLCNNLTRIKTFPYHSGSRLTNSNLERLRRIC